MKKVGFVKKWFMALVCLMMLGQQQHALAQAQAVAPVANYVVNRAIAGTIAKVALQRGFAANDPRIIATMAGVGSSMTAVNVASTVGGVALAVAGAPVWLTVLGGLGILAAGAAIVAGSTSLKVDGGSVTVSGGAPSVPAYTPPPAGGANNLGNPTGPTGNPIIDSLLRDGTRIYRTDGCLSNQACMQFPREGDAPNWVARRIQLCGGAACTGGEVVALYFSEQEFIDHIFDGAYWTTPSNGNGTGMTRRTTKTWEAPPERTANQNGTVTIGGWYVYKQVCMMWNGTSGSACDPGYDTTFRDTYWSTNFSSTLAIRVAPAGGSAQQYASLDAAVSGITAQDKAKALSPEALARVVDSAWARAASQPGYQGLPYSVTQPVTPAEVSAWQNENPTQNPTLGDLLVPAVAPGTVAVPISPDVTVSPNPNPDPGTGEPTPAPAGTTNVNVVNVPTVRVEWGADPGISAPSLEQAPTASAILTPLLNLMPSLRNFAVPAHNSVCPKPSFSMFQKQIVMEAHCAVLDDVKPTLYAIMGFVWLMLAAFIILRA